MRRTVLLALLALGTAANAQDGGTIQFVNLTASAITSLKLSPAGKSEWGSNQVENSGGGVAYNKQLDVANAKPGAHDVKFRDGLHRECVMRNIDLAVGKVIEIEERKLVGLCSMF